MFPYLIAGAIGFVVAKVVQDSNTSKYEEGGEVSEKENYRNYCSGCFKNNLSSHKCISCENTFNKLPNETWKKTCRDCYYKGK